MGKYIKHTKTNHIRYRIFGDGDPLTADRILEEDFPVFRTQEYDIDGNVVIEEYDDHIRVTQEYSTPGWRKY